MAKSRLKAWTPEPQLIALIQSLVEPHESLLAVAPASQSSGSKEVWVLTEECLRSVRPRKPGLFSKSDPWTAGVVKKFMLSDISSVQVADNSTARVGTGVGLRFHAPEGDVGVVFDQEPALALATELQKRAGTVASSTSASQELAQLAALRGDGLLTDAEWEQAKDYYLGKPESERSRSIQELQQIYSLCRSGVLSEGEFNMKKWEILSRR